MANASHDNNFVKAKLAILNTDGKTLVPIKIKESSGGMLVSATAKIFFTMTPLAPSDDNFNKVMMWEGTDGKSYPFVADNNGAVLISV